MSTVGLNPYAAFTAAQPTGATTEAAKSGTTGNAVTDAAKEFKAAIQTAEEAALNTATTGADPHAMVEALANAELVLDTAVTIRDKVVEAYQEVLRMPV